MILWIIQKGEKVGPFEDYQLREMIREGEVERETRVWHEGAEGWLPAHEVSVLKGEFVKKEVLPPPLPVEVAMPPFHAWRRLGARVFDYFLYQLIFVSVLRGAGFDVIPDSESPPSVWFILGMLAPAILMEAALVSSIGFTPGKWLMSLRVETHLGARLSTSFALIRTMRVWVLGMGMMQPFLLLLGHGVTLWFGLKKGAPLWDLHSKFRVPAAELNNGRVILYWGLLTAVIACFFVVMWPEIGPEMMEIWEEAIRKQQEARK